MRAILLCLALAGCGGGSGIVNAVVAPAAAQVPPQGCATVDAGWFGSFESFTASWCNLLSQNTAQTVDAGAKPVGMTVIAHSAPLVASPQAVSIPFAEFSVNDNPQAFTSWGHYSECDITSLVDGSVCLGFELDVSTQGHGIARGLQVVCGSGWIKPSVGNCETALNIGLNPHSWTTGINISAGAVTGDAISLPAGTCIVWHRPDGSVSNKLCG